MVSALLLLALALPRACLAARGHTGARAAEGTGAGVTPVQKVLSMMEGMMAKGKQEKHEEEVEFAKFQEWCEGVRSAKTRSIKESSDQITQLSADIAKAESDAETLAGEIAALEKEIAEAEAQAKSATGMRKKEHSDFLAQETDYSESIDAIQRAVQVLKTRTADVPQALTQVQKSALIPLHAKAALESFLQSRSAAAADAGAPEANAYEFQSGGVIDMLEKLEAKFKEELLGLQKAEMSGKANYQMLMQQLEDDMKADKSTVAAKTSAKAGRIEDSAAATGDLKLAESAKAEDEKTLSDTLAECHMKSEEFEKNQVTRAEELKAIGKAVEILSSAAVKGAAETHLPALLQARKRAAALAQVVSTVQGDADVRRRAVAYLQERSEKLDSKYLSVIAAHAAEDPFGKVKKMIKDLLARLMEEANEEADQHAYCTSELATNKKTREDKTAEAEKLSAEVDQLTSEVAGLAAEIQQLSDAMAEIQGQRAEAQKLRSEEKANNAKAVSDAKEAQVAVQQALQILRAFYAGAAEGGASALLQSGAKGAAAHQAGHRGREPYTGMQDTSTGVLGMLQVILSDFARLESETSSAEDQAVAAHERFMAESSEDLAVKGAEVEHKESKKQQTEELLRSSKKELGLTSEELAQAQDYYAKLKADCVDHGLSYQERWQHRQEEIQSLKEALRILTGEDLA